VITLLVLEVRRLLARRLTRVLISLIVLGIVVAGVVVFVRSNRDVAAARAQARERQRSEIEGCVRGDFGPLPGEGEPGFNRRATCEELVGVSIQDPRFHLANLPDIFLGTSIPAIILAWILAASFLGAEWHSGTMTTWLTWEPRRTRVLVAKAVAAMATAFGLTVVLQLVLGIALVPAAAVRGSMAGVDSAWAIEVAGVLARGGAAAALMALLGLSLAGLGRNTAAALGAGFVYLAVVENLVRGLRPQWAPWLLTDNAARFVVAGPTEFPAGRTTIESALLVTAYAVALFGAALVAFRTRDVT
jgi:ABC-type transport system involved in multi-copper enzyme maturation permease subunit